MRLEDCYVHSPEFGWKSSDIHIENSTIESEYAFLDSRGITAANMDFSGKYSFQYVRNMTVSNSRLKSKDAFWHTKNVTVKDSLIEGEYLGWYSENLTLIRCHIKGTQPLCYCKNLKLIDCTTEEADLAFEYSGVHADIKGAILSVKNPRRGKIEADRYGSVILSDGVYPSKAKILKRIK